jgi:predicted glycoside hydrolase/deacetylase ChbG (UPF0249 family)
MVWMPDSERAATLARERNMPVGLHLNLTLPFRGGHVPGLARELQAELAERFDAGSWNEADVRSRKPDPRIQEAIAHQLGAFRAQFGEPTHIDGHHHIHVHPDVLLCLPRDLPVRSVLRAPNRLGASPDRRDKLLHQWFRAPDGCVGFQQIHPEFGGAGLDVLSYSHGRILEVMVHAQIPKERSALHGPEWRDALASLELRSYRALRR